MRTDPRAKALALKCVASPPTCAVCPATDGWLMDAGGDIDEWQRRLQRLEFDEHGTDKYYRINCAWLKKLRLLQLETEVCTRTKLAERKFSGVARQLCATPHRTQCTTPAYLPACDGCPQKAACVEARDIMTATAKAEDRGWYWSFGPIEREKYGTSQRIILATFDPDHADGRRRRIIPAKVESAEEYAVRREASRELVETLVKWLTPQQMWILGRHFWLDQNMATIGRRFGVHRQTIQYHMTNILKVLRENMPLAGSLVKSAISSTIYCRGLWLYAPPFTYADRPDVVDEWRPHTAWPMEQAKRSGELPEYLDRAFWIDKVWRGAYTVLTLEYLPSGPERDAVKAVVDSPRDPNVKTVITAKAFFALTLKRRAETKHWLVVGKLIRDDAPREAVDPSKWARSLFRQAQLPGWQPPDMVRLDKLLALAQRIDEEERPKITDAIGRGMLGPYTESLAARFAPLIDTLNELTPLACGSYMDPYRQRQSTWRFRPNEPMPDPKRYPPTTANWRGIIPAGDWTSAQGSPEQAPFDRLLDSAELVILQAALEEPTDSDGLMAWRSLYERVQVLLKDVRLPRTLARMILDLTDHDGWFSTAPGQRLSITEKARQGHL